MAKVADQYFETDPWRVVERGFDPDYGQVAESVFSLGNEYMGVRGYFEEGYSGNRLLGSYFNGIYERRRIDGPEYKGLIHETEFMVNSLDWLFLRIRADEEELDLARADFTDFRRILDLRTGKLTRRFLWKTRKGNLEVCFERILSMEHFDEAAQRIFIQSDGYKGSITVEAGLNFRTTHGDHKAVYWDCTERKAGKNQCSIKGQTKTTKMEIQSFCQIRGSITESADALCVEEKDRASIRYSCELTDKKALSLEKCVINETSFGEKNKKEENIGQRLCRMSFEKLLAENEVWWSETWKKSDIEIEGDEENQQGIRFCIFQMFQTYHGALEGTNIGAKGLTGEAYNGNAFWDTETYCLPFFLFHNRTAARNLLFFRYATLEEAKKRATALDCKGAFYPIATISGRECCNLWQHASLQLQASTAVAYGIWLYEKITGDREFLYEYGMEMLTEICRMLATRGDYDASRTHYGYYCVMGPDEFQMMVNQNCYTNYMGRFVLLYTAEQMKRIEKEEPEAADQLISRLNLTQEELEDWKTKAEDMYIPYDREAKLYEQHEGYFHLPHIDVDKIPVSEFPLYSHWSYDRIYRNDMIKQPDVLMLMLLFNSSFSEEELKANYEFYEPRCIHESSLSPSVHSILAAQLGKKEEAFSFFRFATRMDLDNYNRNSGEGLHTTSIAAAWMNIVYGFGGLRADGELLALSPGIPDGWSRYQFRIVYQNEILTVEVDRENVRLKTIGNNRIELMLYGEKVMIDGTERAFATSK